MLPSWGSSFRSVLIRILSNRDEWFAASSAILSLSLSLLSHFDVFVVLLKTHKSGVFGKLSSPLQHLTSLRLGCLTVTGYIVPSWYQPIEHIEPLATSSRMEICHMFLGCFKVATGHRTEELAMAAQGRSCCIWHSNLAATRGDCQVALPSVTSQHSTYLYVHI